MPPRLLPALALLALVHVCGAAEPNPPVWPDSVAVFSPADGVDAVEAKIQAAFAQNGGHSPSNHGQFSDARYAFLFQPGEYDVDCPVGYYTQVLGLGASPNDVRFTSPKGVYAEEGDYSIGGALSTFWRSAENFRTSATFKWAVGAGMTWAVSQAAPLRRIVVDNDLLLFEYQPPIQAAGEASGGYAANVQVSGGAKAGTMIPRRRSSANINATRRDRTDVDIVEGTVAPGSQQQWMMRDSTISKWGGGVWNMVFTGVEGAPASHCGDKNAGGSPFTTVDATPTISEKPYITFADGKYALQIPPLKTASSGANFDTAGTTAVDFSQVYVTQPSDTAAAINAKLAQGLHVVLSPAIYELDAPLALNTEGQVLLGLGLATLVSKTQQPVITVGDVDGVRVAGVIVQAGPVAASATTTPALIQWGSGKGYGGNPKAPGFLQDVFARVGGPDGTATDPVAAGIMLHVRNGNVIGDNLWLWRADHAAGGPVVYDSNRCDHGLVVDGDDVTMYGLAVEHTDRDLTVWNGDRGRTYFYQSELPYIVTQDEFPSNSTGYRVAPHVTAHGGWGIGVYCFFDQHNVTVTSGIVAPPQLEGSFVHPLTVFLNGNGGITHILNDKGTAATAASPDAHYLC